MGKYLVILGVIILITGVVITLLENTPFVKKLGHLPGDISFRKGNVTLYIPLGTSLVLSLLLSILISILRK